MLISPGTLYIVATPIGNLADLTPRAAEVFAGVDFIAAEDTRVTLKLLNHLGLKKPLISYNKNNETQRRDLIFGRLLAGESCALCSDAGTPAVSDPGESLVRGAYAKGIPVSPIPGVSALIAALSVSGQLTGRFVFEGFLPLNKKDRNKRLQLLQSEERTVILYEAPHRLPATLNQLCGVLGAGRALTVCRELTKRHEEIWPATLQQATGRYRAEEPRGEFVLVLAGAPPPLGPSLPLQAAVQAALAYRAKGLAASEAARRAAADTGHRKSEVYRQMLCERPADDD